MHLNVNPKKFRGWAKLRYDILFNGLTVIQAAEKYKVTTAGISQHLKKYPHIKRAYYERPWAERQLKFEFFDKEDCLFTREVIDDYYINSYPPIHQFDQKSFNEALEHREHCKSCREYERQQILKSQAPFRIDCPPIVRLVRHLRPAYEEHEKTTGEWGNDIAITEHLLVCNFCRAELYHYQKFPIKDLLPLIEKERELYPTDGWRSVLSKNDLDLIIRITAEHPDLKEIDLDSLDAATKKFIKWRRFRKWTMQPKTL